MTVDRRYRRTLLATCTLQALLSACTMLPHKPHSFANPPEIGDVLQPQSGLALCDAEASATAMALTGFFLPGCATLTRENPGYRVVAVEFRDLGNNQQFWLVSAIAEAGDVESVSDQVEQRVWTTFPWHDWA